MAKSPEGKRLSPVVSAERSKIILGLIEAGLTGKDLQEIQEHIVGILDSARVKVRTVVNAGAKSKPESPEMRSDLREAKEIMKEDFFGPEQVNIAFDTCLVESQIPAIPFSTSELEKAKENGLMLVLRVACRGSGQPLTIKSMADDVFNKSRYHESFVSNDFYAQHTPRAGWVLLGKGHLPGSEQKSEVNQTEMMLEYFRKVFSAKVITDSFRQAVEQFTSQKDRISRLLLEGIDPDLDRNQKYHILCEAIDLISSLGLNRLLRRLPVEIIYDTILLRHFGIPSLPDLMERTPCTDVRARLVSIGGETIRPGTSPADTKSGGRGEKIVTFSWRKE